MTAEELAIAVGVKQSTICRIENATAKPSLSLAVRLSSYFGHTITRDEILFPEFHPQVTGKKPVRSAQRETALQGEAR